MRRSTRLRQADCERVVCLLVLSVVLYAKARINGAKHVSEIPGADESLSFSVSLCLSLSLYPSLSLCLSVSLSLCLSVSLSLCLFFFSLSLSLSVSLSLCLSVA